MGELVFDLENDRFWIFDDDPRMGGEEFFLSVEVDSILDGNGKKLRKPALTDRVDAVGNYAYTFNEETPDWLRHRIWRYEWIVNTATIVLAEQEKELTKEFKSAEREFVTTFKLVIDALDERPGEASEQCLEILLARACWDLCKAGEDIIRAWRRERKFREEGKKRGHAANSNGWVHLIPDHPEWTRKKKRGNGVGWEVSGRKIAEYIEIKHKKLGAISHTTIDRYR